MLELDPIRTARQEECIDKWEKAGYNGIADWYPGTGKTYLAILAIQRVEKIARSNYVISVPNEVIYKQWIKLLATFPVHLKNRIIVKTKGTLLAEKLKYKGVGLFIIDEIHEYTSEKSEELLDRSLIEHKMFLGLTGTTNHVNFRNVTKYYPIIDTVTEYEAKSKGFIAEMIEYNLGLTMVARDIKIYENYSRVITELLTLFDNNLMKARYICYGGVNPADGIKYQSGQWAMALAMKKGWSNKLDLNIPAHKEIDLKYNPSAFISNANLLMTLVNKRMHLLANTSIKLDTTIKLLKKFSDSKAIIFSESTKFADKVGLVANEQGLKTSVFHSQVKTQLRPGKSGKLMKFGAVRLKKEALEGLTNGTIPRLSTTRSLDKGLNIPDLRFSIITSGTGSIDQDNQRRARAGRKEADSDDPVLNVTLYIKDTQDEVWLRKRQENNNSAPIFVEKIEDIVYRPQPNYFNYEDL